LKVVDPFHRVGRHTFDGEERVGAIPEGSSFERVHREMFAGGLLAIRLRR
jgi:hypothetical protein